VSKPGDLSIVIPTRDRWPILRRTLDALAAQTVSGFEVVVAVDGEDQRPPDLPGARVVQKPAGGSASTRNAGMAHVSTPLAMLLDDDMIPVPNMVELHLAQHAEHPDVHDAVLGRAAWHPELGETAISRWLDRSGLMFEFDHLEGLDGTDLGWGRFCSCNVSFKTELFRRAGGFDETFVHYYEDTDLGLRMGEQGMRLYYEPGALTHHLQTFDWDSVERRFDRVALGERLMVHKHPGFDAWFEPRMRRALEGRGPSRLWPHVAERMPEGKLRRGALARADRVLLRRLAPSYLAAYERAGVWGELVEYLGDDYDPQLLVNSERVVEEEEESAPDEATFYRTSKMYLYDLSAFEMSPTKEPYRAAIAQHVPPGGRILDYGCGIGADGIALLRAGYDVAFADFDNPSTEFLRWRLARRGIDARVYDIDADEVPTDFDAVMCFDVIEHIEDPHAFLDRLESLADVVAVNFLEPDPHDTHLHRPLPIGELIRRAARKGLLFYRRYHGRSHLVLYRSRGDGGLASSARYAVGRLRNAWPRGR